jgi:branched-chain amino acid transport system substrate-binding protein
MNKLFALLIAIVLTVKPGHAEDLLAHAGNFRVGVIAPLSGPLAEYGVATRNGIEIARTNHSELLSKISFEFEDSQWDAKQAVSAFQSLRTKTDLIFNWGNPTTEAIAPIAEKLGVPLLGMTLDPASSQGRAFVIRTTNPAEGFSEPLANYLKKSGYRRIGLVLAQNTYVQGLYDGLKKHLASDQSVEVIATFPLADLDFRSAITRIGSKKFDAVGVFLITGQVSTFYRQLRQQGLRIPTFGTDFFESASEIELAAGGMDGAIYPHLAVTSAFAKQYQQKFGNDFQLAYAGNAHDIAILIGTLFGSGEAPKTSSATMERLRAAPTIEGVAGSFQFRHTLAGDSYFEFPVRLKKIVGKQIENLD